MDEIFPWDFLDCGVTKEFLMREWKKALKEEVSLNCKAQCQGCGANKYGVGICTVDRSKKCEVQAEDADNNLAETVSLKVNLPEGGN